MSKYRVIVVETQTYEVCVEANNETEAEDIALETYGCYGDIISSDAIVDVKEKLQ